MSDTDALDRANERALNAFFKGERDLASLKIMMLNEIIVEMEESYASCEAACGWQEAIEFLKEERAAL